MDSPKTVVSNTSTVVSDSPPVQESPFLNYANNLSPIKPVKVAHGAQGFSALSSTPLVFTSPRTLPDRGTSFSQRSQLYHISSATMSENDDPIKKLVDSSDNVEESFTSGRLMTDTQKNNDQDKPGSFLVRVDEFINDTVDVDCANSVNIENPEQEEGFSQGQSEMEIKLGQAREETHDSKEAPIECQKITSDLPVDQFDDKKHCGGLWPNIIHTHEDYGENTAASTHGPIVKQDPEANQPQRGLSRRCLQFEEARQKRTLNSIHSANLTNNASGSISLASTTELKNQDSSDVELTACSDKQMISIPESTTSTFPPCFIGKSHAVVSKPSGIGLHLNSIINTVPMGYSTMVSIKETAITSCHQDAEDGMLQNHVSLTSDYTGNFEELNELSPTKKRRKKSLSNDGDGCKRCNCKKTKCLKLYCDCFAAGIYCAEPCACQGCLNRPEYEDTVLDTRQQIESRNPLAFAPKIVQNVSAFSAATKEDGSRSMQSLSRHKRGCNCKKSMCLKKYCECYQANVGCSSECRCEWCKNVYGRKEDYGMTEGMVINRVSKGRLEGRLDDKLAMVATNDDFLHTELNDMQNITPSTPSIQHSDHGKWAPNSRVRSTTHVLSSYGNSAIDSHSNEMISESKEIEKGKSVGDLDSSGHVFETMGQFSPRCNTLADVYALTPLHSVTIASSASSKTRDWTSGSRFQLRTGSCNLPSSCSLRRQPSPITPMTLLGESKNKGHDPSGLYNILEDETPEILKEASTHTASVKSSSPNKKRVSPPHNHFRDFRSSSSGGLKSGRKFILKSVPSFPSLTPCGKSEGITEEKQQQ